MFASRAIAASDQAVLEVSAQEMEALFGTTTQKIDQDNFQHGSCNLEIILRDSLVDILRAPHSIPGLKANTLLASLFTDGRRYDAGHTGLPGMRPLPGSV